MLHRLNELNTYEEDIRKSRFIAVAGPVDSPGQALSFIAAHSVAAATHNCWAYRIGDVYRFNDDGEPGGTAGRPILQAMEGQQCDQVAVLVIRWFGGIKLGTGGLVRAYGGVAAQCLRQAAKTPIVPRITLSCHCPFGDMALVQSRMAASEAAVAGEAFDASGVAWRLTLPVSNVQAFTELFVNLTRGQGAICLDEDL